MSILPPSSILGLRDILPLHDLTGPQHNTPKSTNVTTTSSSDSDHAIRAASISEQCIIDDVLLLLQLKPTERAYSRYSPDAIFQDPVSSIKGLENIKSHFDSMLKIFTKSIIQECNLLADSPSNAPTFNLIQHYVFKSPIPLKTKGMERTIHINITLCLNEEGLIQRHLEKWNWNGNDGVNDGFVRKLIEARRKANPTSGEDCLQHS